MTRKQKRMLVRILVAAALTAIAAILPLSGMRRCIAFLVPYAVIGWDVLWRALRNIRNGQVFDEHFLMSLASVGAFCTGETLEAVAVMLFFRIGELFESWAVARSRRSIGALMDISPDYANIETDGTLTQVSPESLAVGTVILVKPGEKIPLDGIVIEGESALDTAALSGESAPRAVRVGDSVISGCVNLHGLLRIRTTKPYSESTVARIMELVESASERKASAENFITRFARIYTPAVVTAAALLAVLPPLFFGAWTVWLHRALTFLVVSCPCALVISVPLTFFGGIGGASRCGILIKGGNYIESLSRADTVVFDKTGTLTSGTFSVVSLETCGASEEEVLSLAAHAEMYSDHPLALGIRAAWQGELDSTRVTDVHEISGHGVRATVGQRSVLVGSARLLSENGIVCPAADAASSTVYVAADGVYLGAVTIADQIRPEARGAIRALKDAGIRRTVMLSGDREAVAASVSSEIGLDAYHAELLPGDKVTLAETMLLQTRGGTLVFVGDGINDAPVLMRADVGIAMGAIGSDAAIEAADVVLMDDSPAKVATAIRLARRTMRIAYQNIVFALGVKGAVLLLGALGYAGMWAAVFADVGVSVLAILNAARALSVPTVKEISYLGD